jgi:hypothetical protein
MKFVKLKLGAFFAYNMFHLPLEYDNNDEESAALVSSRAEDNPIPKSVLYELGIDHPGIILGGKAYRWCRKMLREDYEFRVSFCTSILYSKKGMPRPSRHVVRLAEKKTFQKLTTRVTRPGLTLVEWGIEGQHDYVETVLSRETFRQQIKRNVAEIFKGEKFDFYTDTVEAFFPSTSSSHVSTRGEGGVAGAIMEHPSLMSGLKSGPLLKRDPDYNLGRMGGSVPVIDAAPLREKFTELFERMLVGAVTESNVAEIQGLPESLKVRSITKGMPLLYTVMKPFQKFYHRIMRKIPQFALIGEPVSAELIERVIGGKLANGRKFLSGDYDDATNNIYTEYSHDCVEELCRFFDFGPLITGLHHKAMTEHKVMLSAYKTDVGLEPGQIADQQRGQLMGSVLSFIILCLLNFTVCRMAIELDQNRPVPLPSLQLLINGDDCLFKVKHSGKSVWERIAAFIGLEPSFGKVYYDEYILNINSMTFRYFPEGYEGYIQEGKHRFWHYSAVGYVNLGLMYDIKRSGVRSEDSSLTASLGDRVTTLVETSPSWLRERVLGQFIYLERTRWESKNPNTFNPMYSVPLSWFTPVEYGGLGLPEVYPKYTATLVDLKVANAVATRIALGQLSFPLKAGKSSWRTWQYASQRLKSFRLPLRSLTELYGQPLEHSIVTEDRILGLLCVERLFTAKHISDIYDAAEENSRIVEERYYRAVAKIVAKVLKEGKYISAPRIVDVRSTLSPEFDVNVQLIANQVVTPYFWTVLARPEVVLKHNSVVKTRKIIQFSQLPTFKRYDRQRLILK